MGILFIKVEGFALQVLHCDKYNAALGIGLQPEDQKYVGYKTLAHY